MKKFLPPIIVHDGSEQAVRLTSLLVAVGGSAIEVIDASTAQGVQRLAHINEGLLNGTLDTASPPIAIGEDEELLRKACRARL